MTGQRWRPLGEYEPFGPSRPLRWGERPSWTIAYGAGVIPDLVEGIRAHADTATRNQSQKFWPATAAVGCVPFFTSTTVADALLRLDKCCVVVDKQAQRSPALVSLAARQGKGLSSHYLYELDGLTPPDEHGSSPIVGPYSRWPDPVELGPIRLAGWTRDPGGRPRPQLHAKMLLLGVTMLGEGEFGEEVPHFIPQRTWMGSANWTRFAESHLEYGIWCDDPALLDHNRRFLTDLLRFSETWDSAAAGPEPQLVGVEYDDDAFLEFMAEHGAEPGDEEQ